MSKGSGGGGNPVIQGAMTFLVGGLNALINEPPTERKTTNDNNNFTYITETTDTFATTEFGNAFSYTYNPGDMQPPNALPGSRITPFNDMLVWNEAKYSDSADIQAWLNVQFGQSIPAAVIPQLGKNIADLITIAFQLDESSWSFESKTYLLPFTDSGGSETLEVDVLMVYSSATDSAGKNPTGICRMVAVAYKSNSWEEGNRPIHFQKED